LDALFTFVSYLLQTQPGGQMLMSAGVIPTLVQIVGNQQYTRLKNIAKVVGLLDTLVNSFPASFSSFCNVGGLDTLLNRIKVSFFFFFFFFFINGFFFYFIFFFIF
jgi:E3 ubiquitin-protein ligase HUWE1